MKLGLIVAEKLGINNSKVKKQSFRPCRQQTKTDDLDPNFNDLQL